MDRLRVVHGELRHVVDGLVVRDQLTRHLGQDLLCEGVRISFVLSERHELHDVTLRFFLAVAELAAVTIQHLHRRKVSTANTDNDDGNRVVRRLDNLLDGFILICKRNQS